MELGIVILYKSYTHLVLKVILNSATSIGSLALITYSSSCTLFHTPYFPATLEGVTISKESEIFAFGSTLYEMVTGSEPYAELDAMVERLYSLKKFPDTAELNMLGPVILKCWRLEYRSMCDILVGI